jgi:O-antigen/teichoic acid export membrane protein
VGLILLAGIVSFGRVDIKTYLCLTFMLISLYAENQMMLILTPLRYKRMFKEYALCYIGDALLVLAFGIAGAYIGGIGGTALGLMTAHWTACWILKRRYCQPGLEYNSEQAKVLRSVWLHITVAGMLVLSGPHLNRIVLRVYTDNESVADLFAATGIAYVFVAPVSNFSAFLLSMISRYKTTGDIAGSVLKKMVGLMAFGAILEMTLFYSIAPIAMKILFPKFGDRAEGLFNILVWMIPAGVISAFMRPLLTKFAAVAWIPRINFFVLAVMLILMFSLIPRWGIVGAAWSISMGSIFDAILRLSIFAVIYTRSIPLDKTAGSGRLSESVSQGDIL